MVVARTVGKAGGKYALHFWDTNADKLVRTRVLPPVSGEVVYVEQGNAVVAAVADGLRVIGVGDRDSVVTLPYPRGVGEAFQLRPCADGKRLLSAHFGFDGPVCWTLANKATVRYPAPGKYPGFDIDISVRGVAVAPDGKRAAVALGAPRIDLHDLEGAKVVASLTVETGSFQSVEYSPDGKLIASGHSSRMGLPQVYLWDTATRQLRHKCGCDGLHFTPTRLAFTPDSKYVLAYTGENREPPGFVAIWATDTGIPVEKFDTGVGGSRFALAPDGKTLVTVGYDGSVRKWDFAAIRKEFEAKAAKDEEVMSRSRDHPTASPKFPARFVGPVSSNVGFNPGRRSAILW